jgi:hypothetical protein
MTGPLSRGVSDFAAEVVLGMNLVRWLLGILVVGLAVVVEPVLAGSCEALPAGVADRFSSSLVFIVRRDADRPMKAHAVVLDPDAGQFGLEDDGIVDVLEVVTPRAICLLM